MAENTLTGKFPNLERTLLAYAEEVRGAYQDKLILLSKIASGELLNSVEFDVVSDRDVYSVRLSMLDYWKWVEEGRRPGHFPPVSKLIEWIRVKPVIPRPDRNGKLPTVESLAYLIGRKIEQKGIKPTDALKDTLKDENGKWLGKIAEAFAKDVGGDFEKALKVWGE